MALLAEVILPVPLSQTFTYSVPPSLQGRAQVGARVVVQFGRRKFYSAIIRSVAAGPAQDGIKPITEVLEEDPIASERQLEFWDWVAEYYVCSLGEVMQAALPAGLKLQSESQVVLHPTFKDEAASLDDEEHVVVEALVHQLELSIGEIQKLLSKKTVLPIIKRLMQENVVALKEELRPGYVARQEQFLSLSPDLADKNSRKALFNDLESRAPRQLEVLMAFMQASGASKEATKSHVLSKAPKQYAALKALVDKGVLISRTKTVSRLEDGKVETGIPDLTKPQQDAREAISRLWQNQRVVLLHGVTSSGKTEVYAKLIEDVLQEDGQVLYLLPEIALTAQMIARLTRYFGPNIGVFHSRFSDNERVEIWQKVAQQDYKVIVGARSALWLPFRNLKLIVVDEEHDASYKQFDPAPRYQARDSAIWLASQLDAKVLLGSATPSVESMYNAEQGKYGLVELTQRFGDIQLPKMKIVSMNRPAVSAHQKLSITHDVLEAMREELQLGHQVILFRNRRGFSPFLICRTCSHVPQCPNCNVSLTYHKAFNEMRCHYCRHREKAITACPSCHSHNMRTQGFGTEKVEEELKLVLPGVRVGRLDYDAVRSKHGHDRIISDFSLGKFDVLVGTQMVTKGLDFDNVSLVGILNADQLWSFPDYRSHERAFQLLLQVSGRAGRRGKRGAVLIEAMDTSNSLLRLAADNDYASFYHNTLAERKQYAYPPFVRLMRVTFRHAKQQTVAKAADVAFRFLRKLFGKRIYEPAAPPVFRIRNHYIMDILIKVERDSDTIMGLKQKLQAARNLVATTKGLSTVRVAIDIDV